MRDRYEFSFTPCADCQRRDVDAFCPACRARYDAASDAAWGELERDHADDLRGSFALARARYRGTRPLVPPAECPHRRVESRARYECPEPLKAVRADQQVYFVCEGVCLDCQHRVHDAGEYTRDGSYETSMGWGLSNGAEVSYRGWTRVDHRSRHGDRNPD